MRTAALSLALITIVSLIAVGVSNCQPAAPVDLKPGDKAPDFKLQASDGREYTLAQFKGAKAVALCWFPRAGSQGAKSQCTALQAVLAQLPVDRLQVFGCSTQPIDVTTAFGQQGNYGFPILADGDHAAATAYGCLRLDGLSLRYTFLIDDKGVILAVDKSVTPQNQGTELIKTVTDAGLMPGGPTPPAAASAPALTPGASFTVTFPGMPPTLFDLLNKQTDDAAMTVYLPRNYDPQRKHPLLLFLNGGDGGQGGNPGVARALSEEQDFICVNMPLWKKSVDPNDPANTPPLIVIRDQDGKFAWPLYKQMLAKLDALVPNIDPARRVVGGFSNGAHMTGELIDQSDGEFAKAFSAVLVVEGAGRTQHWELVKGKPVLVVSSNAKSQPRAQQICDAAKSVGAKATLLTVDVGKHDFPVTSYTSVREWLRGAAMQ